MFASGPGIFYSLNCKTHIPILPPNPRLKKRAPPDVLIIDGPQSDCNDDGAGDLSGSSTNQPPPPAPSSTVAPADPPAAASCIPPTNGAVKDAHESELTRAAGFLCKKYANSVVTDSSIRIDQTVISGTVTGSHSTMDIARDYTGTTNEDDVYEFTIKSIDACKPSGGFDLPNPVAGHSCSDLMYHAWKDCKICFCSLSDCQQVSPLGDSWFSLFERTLHRYFHLAHS